MAGLVRDKFGHDFAAGKNSRHATGVAGKRRDNGGHERHLCVLILKRISADHGS